MIIKFVLIIIILIILILLTISYISKEHFYTTDICRGKLSDIEYLEHMIPHHQVAVDISIMLQKKTKMPKMQEILRKLIWTQNYEINIMKDIKNQMVNDNILKNYGNYISLYLDLVKPNKLGLTQTYCDPMFFDPEKHGKHMEHMELDDNMYIKHMIPHHQVAIDMSKVLLKNTKNSFMIYMAYRIIRSQQEEIILLNDLLNQKYKHKSNLII